MKRSAMTDVAHRGTHDVAPKAWRSVPVLSGDPDLDATILHRDNPDMANRMNQHIRNPSGSGYGPRVRGQYHGNHKDD